jgi:DNA-binding NarL/FixJ family response regulator
MQRLSGALQTSLAPDRIEQHLYQQRALRLSLAASTAALAQTSARVNAAAAWLWDWREAHDGNANHGVAAPQFEPKKSTLELASLTRREVAVLTLIAEGYSSKEVAHKLGITFKTACCHRFNLMQKLKVREVASLVRIAIRCGLIQP